MQINYYESIQMKYCFQAKNPDMEDEVAEWLRRWTANPLGSARVGSNPILVDAFNGKHLGGVLNRYQYSTDR